MIDKIKNNIGFSLIELIVSTTIICITVIAISSLFANAIRINKISEQQYNATLLAQSFMESIRASDNINIGLTTYNVEDIEIVIDISEISKYQDEMYKVIVKVIIDDNVLEKIEGFKILIP